MAAIRRWRNAPCFRRIWGVWGDFARENPPRTSLFCALFAVEGLPMGEVARSAGGGPTWPVGLFLLGRACLAFLPMPPLSGEVARSARGALPGRWGFFSWGGLALPFCQYFPSRGGGGPFLSPMTSPTGELGPGGEAVCSTERLAGTVRFAPPWPPLGSAWRRGWGGKASFSTEKFPLKTVPHQKIGPSQKDRWYLL